MFPFCKFLLWQSSDLELREFPAHAIPFLFCLPLLGNSHQPPGMFGSGSAHCSAHRPSHEGRRGAVLLARKISRLRAVFPKSLFGMSVACQIGFSEIPLAI